MSIETDPLGVAGLGPENLTPSSDIELQQAQNPGGAIPAERQPPSLPTPNKPTGPADLAAVLVGLSPDARVGFIDGLRQHLGHGDSEGDGNGDTAEIDETPEPDWKGMATEILGEEGRGARLCNLWMSGWKDGGNEEPDYIKERLWLTSGQAETVVKGILEVLRPFASHRGDDWPGL